MPELLRNLLNTLQAYIEINAKQMNRAVLISEWQKTQSGQPLDTFTQNLTAQVNQAKKQVFENLSFMGEPLSQEFWESELKAYTLTDDLQTLEVLEKHKTKLQKHLAEVNAFLSFVRNEQRAVEAQFNESNLLFNIEKLKNYYLEQINKESNKTDEKIKKLKDEIKKEQNQKKMGIGENVTLPKKCVIVYIFNTDKKNEIFSVPSGGHLAVEVINGNQSLYLSAGRDRAARPVPLRKGFIDGVLERLHFPKNTQEKGRFRTKAEDLDALTNAHAPLRYKTCQALIFDCSGPNPKLALDVENMLLEGQTLKSNPFEYHFWKNNCADMVIKLLQAGGLQEVIKKWNFKIPKKMGVTAPIPLFNMFQNMVFNAEASVEFTQEMTPLEQWRHRFGRCKSELLVYIYTNNLLRSVSEKSPAQDYLDRLYHFFLDLENKMGTLESEPMVKLQTFLKETHATCISKLEEVKNRLNEEKSLLPEERERYQQALGLMVSISSQFNVNLAHFLTLEVNIFNATISFELDQELKGIFEGMKTLSFSEVIDSRKALMVQREKIKDKLSSLNSLELGKPYTSKQLAEIKTGLEKIIGNLNQKIFFELESDPFQGKRGNLLTYARTLICPQSALVPNATMDLKSYTDLRAAFMGFLKEGKYASFQASYKKEDLASIPSLFKFWRRQERLEKLELREIQSIIERLEKRQPIHMMHFKNIRPEYLKGYKERIYLIQLLDHLCEGKISENRVFKTLGLSKDFQNEIKALAPEHNPMPEIHPAKKPQPSAFAGKFAFLFRRPFLNKQKPRPVLEEEVVARTR